MVKKIKELPKSWNLSFLYASDNDPRMQQELDAINHAYSTFEATWKLDTRYLSDPDELLHALTEYSELLDSYSYVGKVGYYWILRNVQDQRNPKTKEMKTKVLNLESEMVNKISFFELQLAKVSPDQQQKFLAAPQLSEFRHYLERIFAAAKYSLSEAEEKIILLHMQSAWSKWESLREEFLSRERKQVLNEKGELEMKGFEELLGLCTSRRNDVRERAGKAINEVLRKQALLAEHELNAILLTKKVHDELRGARRPDELVHVDDDIESEVVDTLIATVTDNFSLAHRYYKLKAKLMGKTQLEYHDRTAEYGSVTKEYTFKETVDIVSKVFHRLDRELGTIFDGFVKDGLIDPYPSAGKQGGAACFHVSRLMPTYQFMNFTGKLRDVTTLAHESGHAVNNVLSRKQPGIYCETSLATAEVASTFMEDFVLEELGYGLTDEERLALYIAKLDDRAATIFRQTALYNFETELHQEFKKKLYFSQEEIGKMFLHHMKSYMGPAVNLSRGSENWWVYVAHIRRPFYVYTYVSGLLISQALQQSVRSDPAFMGSVKEFLSAGTSQSPRNIFAHMGIDISKREFWEKGLREFEILLEETEQLAKKVIKVQEVTS